MARRRKTSPAEELMDGVAKLPWWAGALIALVAWMLLHYFASRPPTVQAQPGQLSVMVTQTIWQTFAKLGQYLIPLICLMGAGLSAWRRRERRKLVADATRSDASDALDGMSWREFEMLVGEGFRLQGYRVLETGGGGADGGVDLVLARPGENGSEKVLVQCKQWRAFAVGVDVVRQLYGVMAARGAAGGFVVTSGRFTEDAIAFADGRNVTLVDGPKLGALLRQAKAKIDRSTVRPASTSTATSDALDTAPKQVSRCPSCSKPMARRIAKRGTNAGREFWGCTDYPACRGTRPIG